jgi:hypothetical protein
MRQADQDRNDSQQNTPHPKLRSKKQNKKGGGGHGSRSAVATKRNSGPGVAAAETDLNAGSGYDSLMHISLLRIQPNQFEPGWS